MWIFWHDWWPWYVGGMTAFTIATAVLAAVLKRRDRPKPCIPITCPPAEPFEISFTVCARCGRVVEDRVSRTESDDATLTEWVCSEHGVVGYFLMLDQGELDIGVIE